MIARNQQHRQADDTEDDSRRVREHEFETVVRPGPEGDDLESSWWAKPRMSVFVNVYAQVQKNLRELGD